jgi:tRNA threonylcarbamoyladenosine biosynthesis protein TsaB
VIVLGIETSTRRSSVAIVRGTELLAHAQHDAPRGHGAFLAPAVQRCLVVAGLGVAELDGMAVGTGPGLYTGLRVGMATAAALASARALPLVGIGGLETMAAGSDAPADHVLVTTLDARRGQAFWAVHVTDGDAGSDDPGGSAVPGAGVLRRCSEAPVVGTLELLEATVARLAHDGPVRVIGEVAVETPTWPDAAVLARLAHPRLAAGEQVDPPLLEPVYLRDADVRIGWRERGGVRGGVPAGDGSGAIAGVRDVAGGGAA